MNSTLSEPLIIMTLIITAVGKDIDLLATSRLDPHDGFAT